MTETHIGTHPRSASCRDVPAAREVMTVAVALFAISATGLAFEVALTRIFSLLFRYHYVFLALSVAVLGLGVGAAVANRLSAERDARRLLALIAIILSLVLPLVSVVLTRIPSVASVIPQASTALVPFTLIGLFGATVFSRFGEHSATLYGADLMGAAVGLAGAVALLAWSGAVNTVIALGVVAGLAALILAVGSSRLETVAVFAVVGVLAVLGTNLEEGVIGLVPAQLSAAPPDKTMVHVLQDPTQEARLVHTEWSPFARVDVVETSDTRMMLVFTDGGAGSYMMRFNGDLTQMGWLRQQTEYLPFTVAPLERTLVIGAGAGKDVLQALLAGSDEVTAVEVNPAIVAATRVFSDYNGGILDRPEVDTIVTDGRNFAERADGQYDLIYLNVVYTQAAEPASGALTESYIFTTEAFRAYWRRLTPGGWLGIVSHQALEGSRTLLTAIAALEAEGMTPPEVLSRAALVMFPHPNPNLRSTVMILRKTPWRDVEMSVFRNEIRRRGLRPLFLPGVFEAPLAGLARGEVSLNEFVTGDEYDLFPTTDDRPFFFNLDVGLPKPLRSLLWLILPLTLLYAGYVVADGRRDMSTRARLVLYFAGLGAAFMLAEVSLIQRFILLLGDPTLALVVVIGSLLLGGGIGSLLSGSVAERALPRLILGVTLALASLLLVTLVAYPILIEMLLPAGLSLRLATAILMLLPLGLLLGVPFPAGLRLARLTDPSGVTLLWGLNAVAAVLGSTLAIVIAMQAGFSRAVALGAGIYLMVALLVLTAFGRRAR